MLIGGVVLAQFNVGVVAERVHIDTHCALACHNLHLAFLVHPIACHLPTIDVCLLSLAVVCFHLICSHELQSLTLGEYAEISRRHCLLSLGALYFQLCLTLRADTFVRILVRSPSVSAVHAGGLSVLQLKGIVVKTFTECPLHLRSLDRS